LIETLRKTIKFGFVNLTERDTSKGHCSGIVAAKWR
jgi:hypothetical protein